MPDPIEFDFVTMKHREAEWAFMLSGSARIAAIDQRGCNFIDDVGRGDLWNFRSGSPHSIQVLEDCEFLLVFDDGNSSENETFLVTDWFAHTPRDFLARNFGVPQSAFDDIPTAGELERSRYIFPGEVPGVLTADIEAVQSPRHHRSHAQRPTPSDALTNQGVEICPQSRPATA
ncbi:cupin domain-containing protein [Mycolicibacterium sp.]|uniref:cupin domain-containing protein n=1 Tax=Mycolicibacterium sp. TaxID=2320850 RepID=UPI003D10C01D